MNASNKEIMLKTSPKTKEEMDRLLQLIIDGKEGK